MLLLNRKIICASELSKIFDVSVRTIYRDIDAISRAGIPIVTETGSKGGISILEEFKIDKYLLSSSDISSAVIALTSIYPNLLESDNSYILAKHKSEIFERERMKSGVENKSAVIKVTLRFDGLHKDDLEKYYDLNVVSLREDACYEAYIYIEASEQEYVKLLSLGGKCECIGPRHIREYIKKEIANIAKNYEC